MNDPNSFGYQESSPAPTVQPSTAPVYPAQYKFSNDEVRVLAECNQESFFKRSLPLGSALGLGTYAAISQGHLRPNPRFGVYPKVTLAVVVGYFIGKLSYQQACAEKLMALPGSYIGQLLRDRRDGKLGQTPKQPPSIMFGVDPNDIYSDAGPGNSLDLDTYRPEWSGDDNYRPDQDAGSGIGPSSEAAPTRPSLSYDDLRRRNRGEYNEAKQEPYRMDPSSMPAIGRPRAPAPAPSSPSTNKYGDSME